MGRLRILFFITALFLGNTICAEEAESDVKSVILENYVLTASQSDAYAAFHLKAKNFLNDKIHKAAAFKKKKEEEKYQEYQGAYRQAFFSLLDNQSQLNGAITHSRDVKTQLAIAVQNFATAWQKCNETLAPFIDDLGISFPSLNSAWMYPEAGDLLTFCRNLAGRTAEESPQQQQGDLDSNFLEKGNFQQENNKLLENMDGDGYK